MPGEIEMRGVGTRVPGRQEGSRTGPGGLAVPPSGHVLARDAQGQGGAGHTVNVRPSEVGAEWAGTRAVAPGFQADAWERGLLETHGLPRVSPAVTGSRLSRATWLPRAQTHLGEGDVRDVTVARIQRPGNGNAWFVKGRAI